MTSLLISLTGQLCHFPSTFWFPIQKRLMKQQNQEVNTSPHFTQMKAQSTRRAALLRIVGSRISILEVCALQVLVQLKRSQ